MEEKQAIAGTTTTCWLWAEALADSPAQRKVRPVPVFKMAMGERALFDA